MENKKIIIIIVVAIIAVVAIAGIIFTSGMTNTEKPVKTTPFSTDFMEGAFVGNVTLVNDTESYMHSYQDKEHNITYNISTIDDSESLMDIYGLQGVTNPEERTINGIEWNIYFTQALPSDANMSDPSVKPMTIIICQSQGANQGYLIYAIFDGNSTVNATTNMFGESYTDFIKPLLDNLTLKESSDVPKINEQFGLTEEEFAQQMDLIHQYYAGNTSALDGTG